MNVLSSLLNFIGNKIGNTPMGTVATTLTGAIAELSPLKSPTVMVYTWADIATPQAQYYTLCTFSLPAKSKYLILARNGNGLAGETINNINFGIATGTATSTALGNGGPAKGSGGNNVVGWYYVETNSACVVAVQTYGYNTSVTGMNGRAVAIPIGKNGAA